ncbi:hypothetical protein FNF31_07166 [Cafeteria roenbergensis]|uniref:Cyclic nucleotide-binding domain-containing protein n=1 Tax=Cafeteria roenbergensis TaxID=33653 RepID=A0A5A8CD00_CAFRO|nr:hypothetical protein FNF31_07166 [Cafeteria roenbergensis]
MDALLRDHPEMEPAIAFAMGRVSQQAWTGQGVESRAAALEMLAGALKQYNVDVLGRRPPSPPAPAESDAESLQDTFREPSPGNAAAAAAAAAAAGRDTWRTADEAAEISAAISGNIIFAGLDTDQRSVLIGAMERREFSAGETIIRQGDAGDYFYVQVSGTCQVLVNGAVVLETSAGQSFGELALLYDSPRAATVVVAGSDPVVTWAIDRRTFKHAVVATAIAKRRRFGAAVDRVPLLQGLPPNERGAILDCLLPVEAAPGAVLVAEGDTDADRFYIVDDGELMAHKTSLGSEACPRLGPGDFFGERAILTGEPRAATVTAVQQSRLLALDRATFIRLLGPLSDLLTRNLAVYDEFDAAARDASDAGFVPSRGAGADGTASGGSAGGAQDGAARSAGSAQSPTMRRLPSVGSSAQLMRAFSQLGSGERGMLSPQARRTFGGLRAQAGGGDGASPEPDVAVMEAATAEEEEEDEGEGSRGEADGEEVYSADELHSL